MSGRLVYHCINRDASIQLSIRELKNEAEDLVETAEFEVGDTAHKMRKAGLSPNY